MSLRVASYEWHPEVYQCAFEANLSNICSGAGYSFDLVHYMLQSVRIPFKTIRTEGTYLSENGIEFYDSEQLVAHGRADLATPINVANPSFLQLNISYLPQPLDVEPFVYLVHAHVKILPGDVIAPFSVAVWLAITMAYLVVAGFVTIVWLSPRDILEVFRISLDQKNFKHFWRLKSQKIIIISWAVFAAFMLKFYRSQLLHNIVVKGSPLPPISRLIGPDGFIDNIDNQPYKLALGKVENDVAMFNSMQEISRTYLNSSNALRTVSSQQFVLDNPGYLAVTYVSLALKIMDIADDYVRIYEIEDLSHYIYATPISTQLPPSIQAAMQTAGYTLTEWGIQRVIERKYYYSQRGRTQRRKGLHEMLDLEWKPLTTTIFKPLITLTTSGYAMAIIMLLAEYLWKKYTEHRLRSIYD